VPRRLNLPQSVGNRSKETAHGHPHCAATAVARRRVEIVGIPYEYDDPRAVSYRVLADHARAVAFLLADGVFPANDGRGYVLRRVLRRAVRHAWLLGRREPTLVHVVAKVIDELGAQFPELGQRREHLLRTTRDEEERFLTTIDSGMGRFDELAPPLSEPEWAAIDAGARAFPVIGGDDAFRLYDTYGFPLDLTELIARERGYEVDTAGFDAALEQQRERSRADRRAAGIELDTDAFGQGWTELDTSAAQEFTGYRELETETDVIALRREDGRVALQLRRNPFYAEAGGQVSDHGVVEGEGWRVLVDEVRKVAGRSAVIGHVEGELPHPTSPVKVRARVAGYERRDTQRNHTATHLLHAALRKVLGTHVVQRGSLVAPDRLRFDFAHPKPLTVEQVREVERLVNDAILQDIDLVIEEKPYAEALTLGAMALFGEKYGDVVRVVQVPGVSAELCGGTHVRHTGDIGLFRIVSESGVAAGIRRIEAITGSESYRRWLAQEELLHHAATIVKTTPDSLPRRLEALTEEVRELRRHLERARAEGAGDLIAQLAASAAEVEGVMVVAREVETATMDELRSLGDALRARLGSGLAVLATRHGERTALYAVASDDVIGRGVRADAVVRAVAQLTGGSGGGKAHMAQGGVVDATRLHDALAHAVDAVRGLLQARR
jgi:alanyl-tRNA synthetase